MGLGNSLKKGVLITLGWLVAACGQDANPDTAETQVQPVDAVAPEHRWRLTSTFSGQLPLLGTLGRRLETETLKVTGGKLQMTFYNPGVLVPAFETFDQVSYGAIEAGWSTSGYWAGKIPAMNLFTAAPFGPGAAEFLSWYDAGGGKELFEELYHRHNIHPLMCGILPPESGGWFKKPVRSLDDLKGLKIRFFGLGGKVLEKVGAAPQLLAGGEIFQALELGTIDATEFSMPAVDQRFGFETVAPHYTFPGWHQQASFFELIVNKEKWDGLSPTLQAQLEAVCSSNIRYGIAHGEAEQVAALASLTEKGAILEKLPDDVLAALRTAWDEVAAEQAAADEDFARVWASLQAFRSRYREWSDRGYVKQP